MSSAPVSGGGGAAPPRLRDLLRLVEAGRVAPPEAVGRFRDLDDRAASPAPAGSPVESERAVRTAAVLRDLDALVGLDRVKTLVREIHAYAEVQRRRAAVGLAADPPALHMVFRGNPGTGKTTVARCLGRLFKETGLLQKGHLLEVERADLVGEYIGHTAQRTRDHIRRALGGVLFIDEAYALARGGEKDFGKEAIDTLVAATENHRDNLVVILAGYRFEMESFLRSNPGLRSRFPIHIDFPDYTPGQLMRIAENMVSERQYRLSADARAHLVRLLHAPEARSTLVEGNARLVRNLVESACRRQAVRLVGVGATGREALMLLTAADLGARLTS